MEQKYVMEIPIEKIIPNPYQPRKEFFQESLKELSASIESYGVIQPISVRKIGKEKYELVAGERRLKAAKLANLETVPAIIQDQLDDKGSAVLAVIENLQREDLNFIEEARGYEHLLSDHGFTQKELAKKIGKNQSTIANKIRILRLNPEILRRIVEEGLTERHGRALLKLPDEELRNMTLDQIIKDDFTVKRTEELVQEILQEIQQEGTEEPEGSGENKEAEKPGEEASPKEDAAPLEEKKSHTRVKAYMNYKIYINTIKEAYRAIREKQEGAEIREEDKGEFIEVILKIPKN
ncbi:ParB/RepB/Spo0J family partition protein [Isachenkonia alkalipeptolytica]|uniref:ParB/RepB/Spo0J family partition protein n=1 Tax=Isachenkonia alkalipeptolytica TaxID=2565777 RepID=A0AA44BEQ5_9CLOT|nr:ParB/RepB/Spo0J family partition protein [Isachenkonia alkalipeptolytica]NBG89218.1 ParB/RepB/Spo0J family partition protein [Isachenkonia alkalipeptolytica]